MGKNHASQYANFGSLQVYLLSSQYELVNINVNFVFF